MSNTLLVYTYSDICISNGFFVCTKLEICNSIVLQYSYANKWTIIIPMDFSCAHTWKFVIQMHYFYIYNSPIEVAMSFKHRGVHLHKNDNWNRTQKRVAQHASCSMHNLFMGYQFHMPRAPCIICLWVTNFNANAII